MYLNHFGLNKLPFDISPDPSFLWLGEKHREALAHLKYGILGDKRLLLITGDVGTGKTALIKCLVKMIDVGAIVVTIPDPDMSRLDFYNFLANELKMGRQFNSKGEFLIHFKNFLLQAYRSYKKVLLIIDEAQRLNHDILQEIRFLTNIDFGGQILINIFLVGQNEFKDILMDDRNKSVRDRITASYQIDPLTETEVSGYIRHRLRVAGTTNLIFPTDAVREIYLQTKGYPRLINILCDRALVTAYINERQVIDAGIIKESARDLNITIGNYQPKKKKAPPPDESTAIPISSSQERTFTLKRFAYINLFLILGFVVYFFGDSLFENFQHLKNSRIATRITDWFQGTEPDNALVKQQDIIESRNDLRPKKESAELSSEVMAISQRGHTASEQEQIITPTDVLKKIGVSGTAETSDQASKTAGSPIAPTGKKTSFVVYFDHSSDEIPPQSLEVLNRITGIFFKSPVKDITLKGYTDSFNNENYEKYMSVERAMRVKKFFVSKGIPASSLNIYGMGSENPTGINTTAEERRKNRRVEIEVSLSQDPKQ
jgi:general secretion pathway protein A